MYFPAVPGGVTIEEPIELTFPKRGRYRERTFQLTTRFPFGFAERRELVTLRHEIIVYPCLDPRPDFEALAESIAGEWEAWRRGMGHDFYRIRPYEALESARHVDWKATAHYAQRLLQWCAEFARDEDQMAVIYLDLDVTPAQAAWFETARSNARRSCCFASARTGTKLRHAHAGHRHHFTDRRRRVYDPQVSGGGDAAAGSRARRGPDEASPFQIVLSANPEAHDFPGLGRPRPERRAHGAGAGRVRDHAADVSGLEIRGRTALSTAKFIYQQRVFGWGQSRPSPLFQQSS